MCFWTGEMGQLIKGLLCKPRDLDWSADPTIPMGVVIDACNPWDWHWEGQSRQISRAHWSADLTESVSFMLVRDLLSKYKMDGS